MGSGGHTKHTRSTAVTKIRKHPMTGAAVGGGRGLQDRVSLVQERDSSGRVAVLLWDGALDLHIIKIQGGKSERKGPKWGPVRV